MIEWNWYFNPSEKKYYTDKYGEFRKYETNVLEKLKLHLRKKDAGYLWLWNIYSGKNMRDKILIDARTILSEKFNRIWKDELPQLENWKKLLEKINFDDIDQILRTTASFFGLDDNLRNSIRAELLFQYLENLPSAHVKKEYQNLLLLNISRVKCQYVNKIVKIICHELIHKQQYASKTDNILKAAYEKYVRAEEAKFKMPPNNPGFHHLFLESVITSVAGVKMQNDYYSKYFPYDSAVNQNIRAPKPQNNNYHRLIGKVAAALAPKTIEYCENGKNMDEIYAKFVSDEWLNALSNSAA